MYITQRCFLLVSFFYLLFSSTLKYPTETRATVYLCIISRVIDTVVYKARLTRGRSRKFIGVSEGAWDTYQP